MPNIIDVARAAGVSPATASRALNNSNLVSDEKRARVRAAAEQLGYQLPHSAGASLAPSEGGVLLCVGIEHEILQDELQQQASAMGCCAMFLPVGAQSPDCFRQAALAATSLLQRQLRGMVISAQATALLDNGFWQSQRSIPLIQLAERSDAAEQYVVSIDYAQAAYDTVTAMQELGYHRIFLLTQDCAGALPRSETQCIWGYRAAFSDAGLAPEANWIHRCDSTRDGGIEWIEALLARSEALPEIILCTSDLTAIGCMQALHQAGISIPAQTAVLAIGSDSGMGYASTPMLSTVTGQSRKISLAITHMLQMQPDGSPADTHRIVIPHTFFCRGSSPQLDPARWPVFD